MRFNEYDSIYFLGIGGIGMSALARWFKRKGLRIAGYDRTPTPLTHELIEEGMELHFDDKVEFIPGYLSKEKTLVIYTPAIPKDSAEYNYIVDQGFTILKRSEVLGLISRDYQTIAVAGTHGKTTTSSLIAHILHESGMDMVAFLGGIASNYDSNLVMQGQVKKETVVVAEADEFDRSFLRLFPDIAVVTSADPDHLDIYGDHAHLLTSFRDFISQVDKKGTLVIHDSVKSLADANAHVHTRTYGLNRGQFFAENITTKGGLFTFDLVGFDKKIKAIELGVPGFHNIENAIAAYVAVKQLGVDDKVIRKALGSFKGVKRRFEYILRSDQLVYIDDYAHHPAEIEAFLTSLKAMYPGKKVTVVFQPHLFTRTRDFADGFAKSLSLADQLVLMDIYPARELPIQGVTSDIIFKSVTSPVKVTSTKAELLNTLSKLEIEVLATVGAGDIDTLVKPIRDLLSKRK